MVVGASLAALDLGAARFGIGRDVSELAGAGVFGWAMLALMFGLPAASVALLLLRRWLALMPLLESVALFSLWFLYYATDWWSNPGQGAWLPVVGLVLIGWLLALAAATGAFSRLRDPST